MLVLDFARIKSHYDNERWDIEMVQGAVEKQKITETEYKEITNEDYTK